MATLYITEFAQQGQDDRRLTMAMSLEPSVANQTVAIGGGSVQSSALNAKTAFVRIHCDVVCSIEFGTNPTAATTTRRMAANATEYFSVPQNQAFKVAVIANT